nr:Chain A, Major prion protein [Heterocephalus glaber]
QYNNQNSFV